MQKMIEGYRAAVRLITREINKARERLKASGDWEAQYKYRILTKQRQQMNEIIIYLEGYYVKKYAYGTTKACLDYEPERHNERRVGVDVTRLSASEGSADREG